jgi:hypothetical protein
MVDFALVSIQIMLDRALEEEDSHIPPSFSNT